ncbi:MAG TPA: PQQ-dependent sugar dehydrogenase [Gaiellaceae bacterium]|nr:PQQ-dependent sugar dehydrogenase [Gaiellaceae bacterium]
MLVIAAALLAPAAGATTAPPTLQLIQVGPGFSDPVYVTSTSADPAAIYVVEQGGRVWRVVNGVSDPRPFLNISSKVHFAGELGLFSVAFSPTYASDHLVYAYYINRKVRVTVSRFKVSGTSAKETTLLTVQSKYHDHNGGQLAFGPDGKLYAATGDGGGGGDPLHSGQTPKSNLGKLLRAAGPTFKSWQIAGFGFRNPWRFSFDSSNGDLYVGDVGQVNREEIDYRTAADLPTPANYGWNRYEGTADYDTSTVLDPPASSTPPVFPAREYDHTNGNCSVIGGYVYRGSAMPDAIGRYFYTDFCSGTVWSMAAGVGDNRVESVTLSFPVSFGTDSAGELYVVTRADGKVYRLSE